MNEFRLMHAHHKNVGLFGISYFGTLRLPSNKFTSAKQVLPGEKVLKDQMISLITPSWYKH